MKTLKQQLQDEGYSEEVANEMINRLKEWLTQKRQRTIDLYNEGKDTEDFLDELLEELNQ